MARSNFPREDAESKLARVRTRCVNRTVFEMLNAGVIQPEQETLVKARLTNTFTEGWLSALRHAIRAAGGKVPRKNYEK